MVILFQILRVFFSGLVENLRSEVAFASLLSSRIPSAMCMWKAEPY
jgi:hypothetical protein